MIHAARILFLLLLLFPLRGNADTTRFYLLEFRQDVDKSAFTRISKGLKEAEKRADYCIIDLNTYGGAVDAADSIRSAILRCRIPVVAFIDIQAASAGALISIACDSIYMAKGSSIGAATVVNGSGEVMPDKYQSFMRAMMRSTAESHGKKSIVREGRKVEVWHRDPEVAEKMVGTDSVLSFTPLEAIENGFCEGEAQSVEEVIGKILSGNNDNSEYIIERQEITALDSIIYFLMNPFLQSLFLMLIIGGIYFEMQSPGIGFALAAAIGGALLYFAPLYLEGLAQYWEILLFIAGIVLLALEIFVIPGFGVAGIAGIIAVIASLTFAMVDNDMLRHNGAIDIKPVIKPLAIVLVSITVSVCGSILLASRIYGTKAFSRIALKNDLSADEGFVGVEKGELESLTGRTAVVATDLKPVGKVDIGGRLYPARINFGYAHRGQKVMITSAEGGELHCDAI